jgi:hypothetical protein
MSVHRKENRWVVRWRAEGRQRSKSFVTKREAVEFERACQRDDWRDGIASPQGAVSMSSAAEGASFLVCEDVYRDHPVEVMHDERSSQRQIHEGYFRSVREADAYRHKMPDADALSIVLLYDRYPLRDLSDDEIAAGTVNDSDDDKDFARRIAEQRKDGSRS